MRKRTAVAAATAIVVAATIAAAGILEAPRSFAERASLRLTGNQAPPWQQSFCVPAGTLVAFAWQTNDTSSVTLEIWSTGLLGPIQYDHLGSNGSGSFYFYNTESILARNTTSAGVQVEVELSFSLNGTYLSGAPSFGAC